MVLKRSPNQLIYKQKVGQNMPPSGWCMCEQYCSCCQKDWHLEERRVISVDGSWEIKRDYLIPKHCLECGQKLEHCSL